jgi:hypothetical protein
MKRTALVLLSLALSAAMPAMADNISGNVSLAGLDTYDATSITFINPADVLQASGTLAILLKVPQVTMHNISNFKSEDGKTLFDWNHLGDKISMEILSLNVVENTSQFLNITGTADMFETGDTTTLYDWSLTSTTSGVTSFTLDAVSPVPEPESLFLVGSGLISLAGFVYWKRKTNE